MNIENKIVILEAIENAQVNKKYSYKSYFSNTFNKFLNKS